MMDEEDSAWMAYSANTLVADVNVDSPSIALSIQTKKGVPTAFNRDQILDYVTRVQDTLAHRFPPKTLDVYPSTLRQGLRWPRPTGTQWVFAAGLDGSVALRQGIREDAEFINEQKREPGVPAWLCLTLTIGMMRFWQALCHSPASSGSLQVVLTGVNSHYLSFGSWSQNSQGHGDIHWNYDGLSCEEPVICVTQDQIRSDASIDDVVQVSTSVVAEIGYYFRLRVRDEKRAKIHALANRLASALT
jgi:hypothetical protein